MPVAVAQGVVPTIGSCVSFAALSALVRAIAAVAIGVLLLIEPAASQPAEPWPAAAAGDNLQVQVELLRADSDYHRDLVDKLRHENSQLRALVEGVDAPVRAKYLEAQQRQYEFEAELMTSTVHGFLHQRIASYVILVLVVCIVLAGLWFAHVQLMAGIAPIRADVAASAIAAADASLRPAGAEAAIDAGPSPTPAPAQASRPGLGVTTIDASLEKVTVTSSVVGIVVLLISLAFLYVYTIKVFEMVVVDPYRPKLSSPAPAPPSTPTEAKLQ
jgi:hypothetical protein